MLYLLDANVLIDANRDYYPMDRVPEYWDWLAHSGARGYVKVPLEVWEEVRGGTDDLAAWTKDGDIQSALLFSEEVDAALVSRAVYDGYAPDLTDDDIERLGRDPFLIAYALVDVGQRCIVTTEVSKPGRKRANRHLPDVCSQFRIPTCNTFAFVRELDFRTRWNSS